MAKAASPVDVTRRLREQHEEHWKELEGLIQRAERRGLKALAPDELRKLYERYRLTLSSLAVARSYALDLNLMLFLNALATRAFLLIYVPKRSLPQALAHFFARDLPRTVRAAMWPILLAALAFAAGFLFGWLVYAIEPDFYFSLHPDDSRHPFADKGQLADTIYDDSAFHLFDLLTAFALFLFQNNVLVALLAFGLGFALGIPTLLVLFLNGTLLGSMVALFWSRDLGPSFIAWLAVHGTTELLAIILAGAGGLMIAQLMLFPEERQSRMTALRVHGWSAATLLIGAMALLFVAAGFEGYLRQLIRDDILRAEIGAGMAFLWLAYFTLAGRGEPATQRSSKP